MMELHGGAYRHASIPGKIGTKINGKKKNNYYVI